VQLSFDLRHDIDVYDIKNFIIHDGNRDVFDFVTSSCILDSNVYLLTGSSKSGKTYLCRMWSQLKKAFFLDNINDIDIHPGQKYILEDIDNMVINENFLLYLINTVVERRAILLITSTKHQGEFNFVIDDLRSRFKNIPNFVLRDMGEESKQKIILKLFLDRQITISPPVLEYVAKKIAGTYDEIFAFVNKIEKLLQDNMLKTINIACVEKYLQNKL